MLAGHYSVSYLLKKADSKIKLWQLFLAVQWLDVVWSLFILLGIEKADTQHPLPASPIHLTYMPYTHGFLTSLLWSGIAYAVYKAVYSGKGNRKSALIIAAAVFSHWLLDLIVHDHDLPMLGNQYKVGFGVYHSIFWSLFIEFGLLLTGMLIYMRSMKNQETSPSKYGMGLVFAALFLFNMISIWGPHPPNEKVVAIFNLCYYIGFTWIIYILERHKAKPNIFP
ncbi:membrane-bound metal-dependent hydrolase YbcI (DUF457 family) [Paenibacillus castaneae]|uniref:hypothetical protein n=1 Tax=Paenibacillus castaneae TaxID=474957 RepID=UPI000C9C959B|nr:hypothetical protein [Paenibacillus castaneae]NIK77767.1 membrane-bound metal-dependent hydrolase YbcI (DUF457 family) [Paenibacillus castaneae]